MTSLKTNNRFNCLLDDKIEKNRYINARINKRKFYTQEKPSHIREKAYCYQESDFPILDNEEDNKDNATYANTNTNYAEAIKKDTCIEDNTGVPVGSVVIQKVNNKIVINHGELSNKECMTELTVQDYMNTAINTMKVKWNDYQEYYDNMNGYGAFEERFILPPIYESDDENENETNSEISE